MSEPNKPSIPVRRRRRHIEVPTHETLSISEQRRIKTEETKERFLVILEEHLGIISYAAAQAGIARRTVYDWMEVDPEFYRRVKEVDTKQLDFVERKLLENIRKNDCRAITFYLSTKGRNRGYTTRVEVTTPQNQPIQSEVTINHQEARAEMGDKAMAKALKAAMRANPSAFTDATRIAIHNGDADA